MGSIELVAVSCEAHRSIRQFDEPVFLRMSSTGSSNVAIAVTSHTTTVAATHDPSPRILNPCVNVEARISATIVDARPIPPRNADA